MQLEVTNASFQASGGVVTSVSVTCIANNVAGMGNVPLSFIWALSPTEQTTVDGWWTAIINKLATVSGLTVTSA